MSPVMVAVRLRATAWAPSRLHGALRVQPLVAVAIGAAYSVVCTLADAAGARATRPPAPNAAAAATARTDISVVFRAWLIGGCLSDYPATDVVRYELRPSRRVGVGPDAVRLPRGKQPSTSYRIHDPAPRSDLCQEWVADSLHRDGDGDPGILRRGVG